MKKVVVIFIFLLLLVGCKAKKEDYYSIKIGDQEIVVGYDENVDSTLPIEYETTELKNKTIISKVIIYVDDFEDAMYLNDYKLSSIKDACDTFDGEYIEKNGHACIIGKRIKKHDNYVILYSDILNDNLDLINRVEVNFD